MYLDREKSPSLDDVLGEVYEVGKRAMRQFVNEVDKICGKNIMKIEGIWGHQE